VGWACSGCRGCWPLRGFLPPPAIPVSWAPISRSFLREARGGDVDQSRTSCLVSLCLGKRVRGQRRGATRRRNTQAVARRCRRHRFAHDVRADVAGLSGKVRGLPGGPPIHPHPSRRRGANLAERCHALLNPGGWMPPSFPQDADPWAGRSRRDRSRRCDSTCSGRVRRT